MSCSSAGEVANSWRHERWDSLRLLTPNWQSRLPGRRYDGPGSRRLHDDGRGGRAHRAASPRSSRRPRADRHGRHVGASYRRRVRRDDEPRARSAAARVVIATGACNRPTRAGVQRRGAGVGRAADRRSTTATPSSCPTAACSSWARRRPASSSRPRSGDPGRPVTLSVGEHVRLPRTYRGRDVLWWMDASGVWDERYDEVDDLTRARRLPSPQLVGTPERATLDLNALTDLGVELVGRWATVRDGHGAVLRRAAQRVLARGPQDAAPAGHLRRLGPRAGARRRARPARAPRADPGARVDALAARPAQRRDPLGRVGDRLPARLHLARRAGARREGPPASTTAAWSTARASTRSGCPVLRRRKSTFIHGIEDDAREVIDHLAGFLAGRRLTPSLAGGRTDGRRPQPSGRRAAPAW